MKRLKPEHRERVAGVIDYCRAAFERQVPFDYGLPTWRMTRCTVWRRFFQEGFPVAGPVHSPASLSGLATGSNPLAFP